MSNKKKRTGTKIRRKSQVSAVYPKVRITRNFLARVAIVHWGRAEPKEYRLDHLSDSEVKRFWAMTKREKSEYLRKNFNRHHRRPRCQNGPTIIDNLSYVDIVSHNIYYNRLISIVARWESVSIEKVLTTHIRAFLGKVYPSFEQIVTYDGTHSKIKSLEFTLHKKTLDDFTPNFLRSVARWASIEYDRLHMSDVRRFVEQIYPVFKRLATDHNEGRLHNLHGFALVLNEIWLPIDEPIYLRK